MNRDIDPIVSQIINNQIDILYLGGKHISEPQLKTVCELLKVNTSIKTVNLTANEVGDNGVKYVVDFLKVNSTITTLYLESNQITCSGAKLIADTLITNRSLDSLILSHNNIGNEGAKYIMDTINKYNTTLTRLNLSGIYSIDQHGVKYVMDALKINTTLKTFGFNNISAFQFNNLTPYVSDMLKTNTTLCYFSIHTMIPVYRQLLFIEDSLAVNPSIICINYDYRPRSVDYICDRNSHNIELKSMMLIDVC